MDKLEAINRLAREATREIKEAVNASSNEAEFRRKFSNILEDIARRLGVDIFLREEYTLATGRADAAYNRLIIEYERPGSLRPSSTHSHTKHAIQQVKDYMEGVAKEERQEISRLAGVALDGCYYVFVRCFGKAEGQVLYYDICSEHIYFWNPRALGRGGGGPYGGTEG